MADREPGHLSPEDISAYLSGVQGGPGREELERHLVVCDQCRQELIDSAELGASSGPRRWLAVAVPVAAAAAVAALLLIPWGGPPTPGARPGAVSVVRGAGSEGVGTLAVVEPLTGATVDPSGLQFRWRSGGQGSFYRVTLTSEEGDVVWTSTSADTLLDLPPEVLLEAGARYFWFVDALLSGVGTATSGVQELLVRE
jgi:hypothetical protein